MSPRPARRGRGAGSSGRRAARPGAGSGRPGGTGRGAGAGAGRAGGTGRGARSGRPAAGLGGDQVEGRQAVRALLAAGRRPVRSVWLAEGLDPSPQLDEIEALAARRHVRVEVVPRSRLEAAARTDAPQGVLARAKAIEPVPLETLVTAPGSAQDAFLLVVAGVTDPHNLGGLLRSAECAGVTGVVLPRHRSAHVSPTVAKVAAGAVEHLSFALVGGIPSALEQLRSLGVWTLGLAPEGPVSLYDAPAVTGPLALVVGGEERGLAPLVRRRCDELVAIPQHGAIESLNVAAATAVACFEVARRRAEESPLRGGGPVGRLSR